MISYPIAISQQGQYFHAQVPDLPHVEIMGDSIIDTIAKARDAIAEHLQQLINDNQSIPNPHTISTHVANPIYAGCTWAIVRIDAQNFKSETPPISVQIPHTLHQKILQHLGKDKASQIELEQFIIQLILEHITPNP
ncbi:type II toxin-antitoxin system HicB family antitoxin [Moraxella oblonga]|uniref:type II toxin-antitoxin system HicB family antitoxin n=1 Tax=Moraxella oblonga TaxID=200413 RepID=UPI0008346976|nr:type II toxin-antitoxin system HicB family antitoxin [Moraxella oblonga]